MAETVTKEYSRRDFVVSMGGFGLAVVLGGATILKPGRAFGALPPSSGYLVVDTLKCGSCETCAVACSLAHEGSISPSTARIQVIHDVLHSSDGTYQEQCRQCASPACVAACPTGAASVDEANGNVRWINPAKCIGCKACIQACPFTPSRCQFNPEKKTQIAPNGTSQKCDLCTHADHWDSLRGPACVAVCPMNAIKLVSEMPAQVGDAGYKVNLRNKFWGKWWPYERYTTWPKAQTTDPSTWPTLPAGWKSVYPLPFG